MTREEFLAMQAEQIDLVQRERVAAEARTPPAFRALVDRLGRDFDEIRAEGPA